MKDMDELDNQRFVDQKTGNSLLFTFESESRLVIDFHSRELDPDDKAPTPIKSIYIDLKGETVALDSW